MEVLWGKVVQDVVEVLEQEEVQGEVEEWLELVVPVLLYGFAFCSSEQFLFLSVPSSLLGLEGVKHPPYGECYELEVGLYYLHNEPSYNQDFRHDLAFPQTSFELLQRQDFFPHTAIARHLNYWT